MKQEIRIPATTVQLVQILGDILRNHIKISLWGTECWTFQHVTDWAIGGEVPDPDAGEEAWTRFQLYENPEHEMTIYLGSGYCQAFGYAPKPGAAQKLQMRVRCEHSRWVAASMSYWDFQIWIRLPDGTIERHHYQCYLGYGQDRDILDEPVSGMPELPPRRIAFWKETPAQAE